MPHITGTADFRLLNDWQRDFPLLPRPFAHIGEVVGATEQAVIDAYRGWVAAGVVSRVGAVFAPRRIGVGALVALAVAPERLEAVAARVSAEPCVNHNYEREHAFNLWFVVTAPDADALTRIVGGIERDTACKAICLPMEEEFHIDLGFDLTGLARKCRVDVSTRHAAATEPACALPDLDRRLFTALQGGLPIVPAPWDVLGRRVGLSEGMVLETVERGLAEGLIRRFGVVVRHHELGIGTNAMCVWDIPDPLASEVGRRLALEPAVTLCYRRKRGAPDWHYNLFCMIHGSARDAVLAVRDELAQRLRLDQWPHTVLFSGRRFKQGGAHYLPMAPETGND